MHAALTWHLPSRFTPGSDTLLLHAFRLLHCTSVQYDTQVVVQRLRLTLTTTSTARRPPEPRALLTLTCQSPFKLLTQLALVYDLKNGD